MDSHDHPTPGGPHDQASTPPIARRLQIPLTQVSDGALRRTAQREALSEAATINRALQLYDVLTEVWAKGGSVLIKQPGTGIEALKMY